MIKIAQFENDIPAEDFKQNQGSEYLQEGRHSVKVIEVGEPKPNDYDQSWVDLPVTFANPAGKIGMFYLSIPTKTLQYQTTKGPSLYRATELLDFCKSAWGDSEFPREVHVYLRKKFGDPDKLKGTKVEVEVGCPFGKYIARRVGGTIKLFKGDVQLDEGEFATFDAAEAHAKLKGLKFVKGPRIIKFVGSNKLTKDDVPL